MIILPHHEKPLSFLPCMLQKFTRKKIAQQGINKLCMVANGKQNENSINVFLPWHFKLRARAHIRANSRQGCL